MKNRLRWAGIAVFCAVFGALVLTLVPAASSSGPDQYTASITPTSVVEGTVGTAYTLTITNDSGSTNTVGSANVTIPSGFANESVGATTAPSGKSWTASVDSGVVELRAGAAADALAPGEAVSVPVTADAPGTRGPATWLTAADQSTDFSNGGAFALIGLDPTVTITGPLDHFVVAPATLSQTAGTPFDVTVTAQDSDDTTVASYTGTVTFSSSDAGSSTSLPPNYAFTGADQGVHTFTDGVTLTTAGGQTVSVADATDSSKNGTSASIDVAPGPIDHFTVATPSGTTAGDLFTATVTAFDQFGNTKTNYTGSVHFTTTDPGIQTSVPADYGFTAGDSGVHAFTNGVKLTKAGAQTVSVADTGDSSKNGTSGTITVSPAAPDHFDVPTPGTQTAGTGFNETLTAQDRFDNTANYSGLQNLTWGGTPCAPSCPGTAPDTTHSPSYPSNPVTFAGGQATVSITLFKAEVPKLGVSDGTISGASGTFTVNPDVPHHFDVPTPGTQTAGGGFNEVLTAQDQFDNTANYSGPQNLTWGGAACAPSCPGTAPDTTHSPSYPSNPVTFSAGQATVSITLFKAEVPKLGVTDGTISGASGTFTVNPDVPHHFDVPTPATRTAGTPFNETLTAQDQFDNTAVYSGNKTLTWGGAACAPSCPGTAPDGTHTPTYPSSPVTFASGQATVSITLFRAEVPKLGVTDGTISGSSGTFTVDPGPLGSFTVGTIATQTAGVAFGITATAFDLYLNQKTNYTGSQNAQLTGTLGNSSRGCNGGGTPTPGGTSQCQPFYGTSGSLGTWVAGVAVPNVTGFKAETGRTLTVKDTTAPGSPQGTSNVFAVNPNEPDAAPRGVTFTVQPGLSKFDTPLTGPPTVKVEDAFGNAIPNRTVTMTIGQHPGGASTTFNAGSGTSVATNASGLAPFPNLNIHLTSVNYTIVGTVNKNPSGTVSGESSRFDVANDLQNCPGNSKTCQGVESSSDNKTFSTVTVTSTTGANLTGNLGTAVSTSITAPPSGSVCAGLNGQGFGTALHISGTAADFPVVAATKPTFTIVTRIDKSIVKASPGSSSPNSFNICMGAINTLTGLTAGNACANPNTDPSFPAKGGGCAVRATAPDGTDAYWAVVPDAPNGAKSCTDSKIKFPVVLSKTKNGQGDVILTSCVPYPFDPHPIGGP